MKRILPFLFATLIMGCAAQYEVYEEVMVEGTPQWTEAQVDSIIKINRMFFFDYYKHMERKNEFPEKQSRVSLQYFWNYISLDTSAKYNDFPQAACCYYELAKENPELSDSVKIVYEMGVKRFPESDYLHNALGVIYKNQGDPATAEMHFKKAAEIDSTKPEYIIPLTEIYQQNREWDKAREACEKVLKLDPSNTVIRDRLETILRDHFSQAEYIAILKEKIQHQPENINNRLKLARQYLNLGKNQEAQTTVKEALNLAPNNVEALELMGVIKQNLADYDGAIKAYKEILTINPKNVIVMLEIASCYRSLGDFPSARIYIIKALKARPNYGSAWLQLGEVYLDAADKASKTTLSYSDKLVYTIAFGLFERAASSNDYEAKENARKKKEYLENNQFVPQKSDWFMRQNQTTPTGDSYNWIDESWDEVKYIKVFLKRYTG